MTRTLLMALLAGAVVLAGCGDDAAEEEVDSTPPPTAAETAAPTEAAEPEPTEAEEAVQPTYRVRRGDTLSAIAERYGTTVRALVRLNDIDNPHEIRAGQRLKVPADG